MSYINERRQEERARRREEIIDAAESIYAELGWDAVTMDKVARTARLSRALLYVYFQDKGDLHLAIVERALVTLRLRMEAAIVAGQPGLDQLEAIGRAYLAFAQESPHLFDACARFQTHHGDEDVTHPSTLDCTSAGHRVHETVVATLREGIEDGSIRNDLVDLNATAINAWAFSHGVIQILASKGGQIAKAGTTSDAVTEQAFSLIRRALQPARQPS
jgi:AcrR family transcriptional regulator